MKRNSINEYVVLGGGYTKTRKIERERVPLGELMEMAANNEPLPKVETGYNCPVCGKLCSGKRVLREHKIEEHSY